MAVALERLSPGPKPHVLVGTVIQMPWGPMGYWLSHRPHCALRIGIITVLSPDSLDTVPLLRVPTLPERAQPELLPFLTPLVPRIHLFQGTIGFSLPSMSIPPKPWPLLKKWE